MKKFIFDAFQAILFIALCYASYLLILLSIPYLQIERDIDFLLTKQLIYHIDWWRISFYTHVFSSPFVIISGLIQFNRWSIHRFKKAHRIIGLTYIVLVLFIAAPSGLMIGLYANGSYPAQISFTILSLLWMLFTYLGFRFALKGDYDSHAKWILRSFLLTLSAVSLRMYAYLFDVFNVPLGPIETYTILAYLSWIPNLIFAEILIHFGYIQYLLKKIN